ncbi:MAG: hypothetical protein ACK4GG_14220 [Sphingomonas sp.]
MTDWKKVSENVNTGIKVAGAGAGAAAGATVGAKASIPVIVACATVPVVGPVIAGVAFLGFVWGGGAIGGVIGHKMPFLAFGEARKIP